jgi:putative endonuclease
MQKKSQIMGREAEALSRKYLQENGIEVIEANWRSGKHEIDIIGRDGVNMVFFEVKARSTEAFGEPEAFVTPKKQRFIIAAAHNYLTERNIEAESRFDILALLQVNNKFIVKHLKDAFRPVAR